MGDQENPEWRDRVDSIVLYDRLEDLRARVKELERVMSGGKDSLRSEYRRHDQDLVRINAVLFQDPTGQKGLLHDVDVLMGRRREKDESRGFKWQFWGVILAATIGALAGILPNLARIKKTLTRIGPLERKIDQARHPHSPHKLYRVRHVQESPVSDSGTPTESQSQNPDLK